MLREIDEHDQDWCKVTCGKEDPLEPDAFIVASGGEGEETFGVILANEAETNSGVFKDAERLWFVFTVDKGRGATVRAVSDEPGFLLTIGGEVNPLNAVGARSGPAWCRCATFTCNL